MEKTKAGIQMNDDGTFEIMEVSDTIQPVPCTCGAIPVKENRTEMRLKVSEGGYPIVSGRLICPKCGKAPDWGKSFSVHCGWPQNIALWNGFIGKLKEL